MLKMMDGKRDIEITYIFFVSRINKTENFFTDKRKRYAIIYSLRIRNHPFLTCFVFSRIGETSGFSHVLHHIVENYTIDRGHCPCRESRSKYFVRSIPGSEISRHLDFQLCAIASGVCLWCHSRLKLQDSFEHYPHDSNILVLFFWRTLHHVAEIAILFPQQYAHFNFIFLCSYKLYFAIQWKFAKFAYFLLYKI